MSVFIVGARSKSVLSPSGEREGKAMLVASMGCQFFCRCRIWFVAAAVIQVLSLGIFADSFPYGWGGNVVGQVGNGTLSDTSLPVAVSSSVISKTDVLKAVSAGGGHSVALRTDGAVYAWGANGNGQLGDGTTSDRSRAVLAELGAIPSGVILQQVSAGGSHSLALGSDGQVYAWGANGFGQLGDGTLTDRTRPVAVSAGGIPSGVTITEVRAGRDHSLALGSDGKVYAWGRNASGQLGDGTVESRSLPVAVLLGSVRCSGIAAGRFHSLGLASDGKVYGGAAMDLDSWGMVAWRTSWSRCGPVG